LRRTIGGARTQVNSDVVVDGIEPIGFIPLWERLSSRDRRGWKHLPHQKNLHFVVPVFAVSAAIDMTVESRHKFGLLAKAPSEGNRPPPTGDAMHPTTKGGCS
jgi:hypothetical protein